MRLGPGLPMTAVTVSADGCDVTVNENESSGGSKYEVTLKLAEYSSRVFGRTAPEAVGQAAERMDRIAKSLRELAKILEGA